MVGKSRRVLNDGLVAATMFWGSVEIASSSYEFGEKTGMPVLQYGLPSLAALVAAPLVYWTVKAFDKEVAINPDSLLNKIEDRVTYL